MLVDEEARADLAACLLVREDVPARGRRGVDVLGALRAGTCLRASRRRLSCRARPLDMQPLTISAEKGGCVQRCPGGRDDVDMPVEEERRRIAAGEARDEVGRSGTFRAAASRNPVSPSSRAWTNSMHALFSGGFVVSNRISSCRISTTVSTALLARSEAGRPRRGCCSGRSPRGRRRCPRARGAFMTSIRVAAVPDLRRRGRPARPRPPRSRG